MLPNALATGADAWPVNVGQGQLDNIEDQISSGEDCPFSVQRPIPDGSDDLIDLGPAVRGADYPDLASIFAVSGDLFCGPVAVVGDQLGGMDKDVWCAPVSIFAWISPVMPCTVTFTTSEVIVVIMLSCRNMLQFGLAMVGCSQRFLA